MGSLKSGWPLRSAFGARSTAAVRAPTQRRFPRRGRNRLILALRALDGRLDGATHREIAAALFGADAVPERDWISHELRDRTARLVRLGVAMMNGGYRRLLLHPYRGRS